MPEYKLYGGHNQAKFAKRTRSGLDCPVKYLIFDLTYAAPYTILKRRMDECVWSLDFQITHQWLVSDAGEKKERKAEMDNGMEMRNRNHQESYNALGLTSASDLQRALSKSRQDIFQDYMRHSELLYHIRYGELYTDLGYSTWEDFCEKHEDMSRRNANYLVELWGNLKELPAEKLELISHVGLSKARLLAKVVDEENVDQWISKASQITCDRLNNVVRRENLNRQANEISKSRAAKTQDAREVSDEEKMRPLRFQLTDDQFKLVVSALDSASKVSRSESQSFNLTVMAEEFLATHASDANLDEFMAMLERSLNATIVVVDNESGHPIYGGDSIEEAE